MKIEEILVEILATPFKRKIGENPFGTLVKPSTGKIEEKSILKFSRTINTGE